MSRTKLLLDVVQDMRSLADSLQAVAEAIGQSDQPAEAPSAAEKRPRAGKKAAEQPKQEPEAKPLTLEEVRAVLAEKSRAGHTAEVRKLLEKHGASKLSEIDSAKYPALLADAEGL